MNNKYGLPNPLKTYGIKENGTKILINSNCNETALRTGITLEQYKTDIQEINKKYFKQIIFEH